ncbi:MAG: hypothetical protein ACLUQK_08290 [Clostridium sp.]
MKEVVARPGELVIAQQDGIITSYALGSSLGICLYDKEKGWRLSTAFCRKIPEHSKMQNMSAMRL